MKLAPDCKRDLSHTGFAAVRDCELVIMALVPLAAHDGNACHYTQLLGQLARSLSWNAAASAAATGQIGEQTEVESVWSSQEALGDTWLPCCGLCQPRATPSHSVKPARWVGGMYLAASLPRFAGRSLDHECRRQFDGRPQAVLRFWAEQGCPCRIPG